MIIELILVEGVSDVQLISYYLQNVYGWKHEKSNKPGIAPLDEHEHIESLSKNEKIIEQEISSLMVVTDRDEDSNAKIGRRINSSLENISIRANQWINNRISDSFGQPKSINTYLLIIPADEKGALERVIINALKDIPEETDLIQEVVRFIDSLKGELAPELNQTNKANKATVGTFFSVRNPQNAMRSFGTFISKIDWSKSESLNELFLPFMYLGEEKPNEIVSAE